MRNLKRALSVALAAVMLLGMMVMGASAAVSVNDFVDLDEIDNKEAVALMVDLGVIEGYQGANGPEFGPKNTLQRSALAKIAFMVATGSTDFSMYTKATPTFKDIKGNWAEGAIEYCTAAKYISGVGDNAYAPDGLLTVAATAKVLLCALGFDADKQGYNGDSWSIFAMRDAKDTGLLNGVSQNGANEYITRDNACQMAYNALFANVRVPDIDRDMGEYYVKTYEVKPYTLGMQSYGLVKYTYTVTPGATAAVAPSLTFVGTSPAVLAAKDDDANATAAANAAGYVLSPDMVGSNVTVYTKVTYTLTGDGKGLDALTYKGLISSAPAEAATNVLKTVTSGIASMKTAVDKTDRTNYIGVELDTDAGGTNYAVTYYLNGLADTAGENKAIASYAAPTDSTASIKKVGTVTEFIDTNNNGKADIVKIIEKSVATLSGDVVVTGTGDKMTVKVPGISGLNSAVSASKVKGYEGLKKGDVVLFVTNGGVTYIEKAKTVEGTVSGVKSSKIIVNGKEYGASGLTATPLTAWLTDATAGDYRNAYTFYLDDNSSVLKAQKVSSGAAETNTTNAILIGAGVAGNKDDLTGGAYVQAKLLFSDATTQIVRVSKVGGTPIISTTVDSTKTTLAGKVGTMYKCAVDSNGFYEITEDASAEALDTTKATGDKYVENNTVKFDGVNLANAATKFVVATKSGFATTYTPYTGIANIPTITDSGTTVTGTMVKANGIATFVYINAAGATAKVEGLASNSIYAYVPATPAYTYTGSYYTVEVYVDGVKTELKVDGQFPGTAAGKVCVLNTINDKGVYTGVSALTGAAVKDIAAVTGYPVAASGTLQVTGGDVYTYNEDTAIYVIDAQDNLTTISAAELTPDKTNNILVIADGSKAQIIFIKDIKSNTATMTVQAVIDGTPDTTATGASSGVLSWSDAGHDGTTEGNAKEATLTIASAAAEKSFALKVTPSDEATVTLVSGTVPTATAASSGTLDDVLVYLVTAEDGTVCYYKLTLAVSST